MVWMLMLPVTTILIMLRRGGGRGGGSAGPRRGPHKEDDLEVDNHKEGDEDEGSHENDGGEGQRARIGSGKGGPGQKDSSGCQGDDEEEQQTLEEEHGVDHADDGYAPLRQNINPNLRKPS